MNFKTKIFLYTFGMFMMVVLSLFFSYAYISNEYKRGFQEEVNQEIDKEKARIKKVHTLTNKHLENNTKKYKNFHKQAINLIQKRMAEPDGFNLDEIKYQLQSYRNAPRGFEIFLINKNKVIYRSTYSTDIGLDLSIFPETNSIVSKAFANDGIHISQLVSKDPVDRNYKIYSYSKLSDEVIIELSFINHDIKSFPNLYSDGNNGHITTKSYSILQQDGSYFYWRNHKPDPKHKKSYFVKTPLYTADNFGDDPIMAAFFSDSPIVLISDTTYTKYAKLFSTNVNTMEAINFVMKYQVSLEQRNSFLDIVQKIFIFTTLLSIVLFLFLHRFLQNQLVKPIELIVNSIDSSAMVTLENLPNHDEFYVIASKYNRVYSELKQEVDKNKKLSLIDPLTGIGNRKAFDYCFDKLMNKFNHEGRSFCLTLFDLDDFKGVNDTFGHMGGDKVLKQLASLVSHHLRHEDYFYRIGGEEFAILLPNISLDTAVNILELIRQVIYQHFVDWRENSITISLGVSQVHINDTYETLYTRVDELLYVCKHTGKNKVKSA